MKNLISIAVILLLSSSITFAQDFCKGDFSYDGSVGAEDVEIFLQHFGRNEFNNPCPPDGPSPVPKTGQTTSYATGDDGDLERGVELATPRFTDNGDGTVTDNLTGLIWLKNANCFSLMTWEDAMITANTLSSGTCGLTDGSNIRDWRLSNRKELFSLSHDRYYNPALSNTAGTGQWTEGDPFNNVVSFYYWSSTTKFFSSAWAVDMEYGDVRPFDKTLYRWVWPVRGGQ